MLSLISFILVCVGCINWFSIGILQFDFVAGIFGSQSNIFSRLIYTLVGIAAIVVIANFVTNKGRFVVSFKKANKEYNEYKEEMKAEHARDKKAMATESADEFTIEKELGHKTETNNNSDYRAKLESAQDMSHPHKCGNCEHSHTDDKNNQVYK